MEWDFGKSTRKCTDCQHNLPEEEFFISALFLENQPPKTESFSRCDYCSACWANKPEGVFSYWKTKITRKQPPKTPREVLMEFFDNLINPDPAKPTDIEENIRSRIIYLFALVLLRRKILKIKENILKDNHPYLVFERITDGKIYEVPELNISEAELVTLREKFAKLFEFEI